MDFVKLHNHNVKTIVDAKPGDVFCAFADDDSLDCLIVCLSTAHLILALRDVKVNSICIFRKLEWQVRKNIIFAHRRFIKIVDC